MHYHLAILGSGGGAFAAAIAARRKELRVAIIERATVGGTCVNVGCIPSKALLAAAEARHRKYLDVAAEFGFEIVHGKAAFIEGPALDVDGRRIEAAQLPDRHRRRRLTSVQLVRLPSTGPSS